MKDIKENNIYSFDKVTYDIKIIYKQLEMVEKEYDYSKLPKDL